ncbi:MAG: IPT/TIG domain-containing protein [Myxococcales bacterium]|nr:IPT/TIG domain-containing protein [Myxococcales bacterium]MCB9702528.1 IPT/TIG domain-containing protein [Myxococcales bacterium]
MRVPAIALLSLTLAACGRGELRVTPTSGAFAGGESLTITGRGFAGRGPLVVYVCERSAKGIVVESDRMIRLRTPRADKAGSCDVRIVFDGGETITISDAFTYAEPTGEEADDPFASLGAGE